MRAHNSTIKVKQKICVSCGKSCYWFSKRRCQQCARVEHVLASDEAREPQEIVGLDNIIHKLDRAFSKIVRLKYADKEGIVKCFTCDYKAHWSLLTNGHYIKREHTFLRWDERNCKPQCVDCNCVKHGNMGVFRANLDAENDGISDILLEESRIVHKWSKPELHAMFNDLSKRLKRLQHEK